MANNRSDVLSSKRNKLRNSFKSKKKQSLILDKSAFDEKYILGTQTLGKGSFAEVKLGVRKISGEKVAIKLINKRKMKHKDFLKVRKEVKILLGLQHENIVQVYDAFSDKHFYYIVMEYAPGGDLFSKIVEAEEDFTESQVRDLLLKMASALKYCKDNGVVHRDIKPENILISKDGEVKLCDFNLSKKMSVDDVLFNVLETECGTPSYVAPEVLSHGPYDYKCDIWSLGVIAFILLSGGFLPFFPDDETSPQAQDELLRKVQKGTWSFKPDKAWVNVSDGAKDLVRHMLKKNPVERITYEDLLDHSWMNPGKLGAQDSIIDRTTLTKMKTRIDDIKARQLIRTANLIYKAAEVFQAYMEEEENDKDMYDMNI